MKFADLAAFILTALCVVAITLLAALGLTVPDALVTIAFVSVGIGGGVALPRPSGAHVATSTTPAAAPAPPVVGEIGR